MEAIAPLEGPAHPCYLRLPWLKPRGFLLSFHLFTLVRKGTLMETNKTYEPTTSGAEDIRASGPNQSVFRWLLLSLPTHAHLRTLVQPKQEKRTSSADGMRETVASPVLPSVSEYSTNVQKRQEGIPQYPIPHSRLAPKGRPIHPPLGKQGSLERIFDELGVANIGGYWALLIKPH